MTRNVSIAAACVLLSLVASSVSATVADETTSPGLLNVAPMLRGASIDELKAEALGRRAQLPVSMCTTSGSTCPDFALAWASGSFVDSFTPAALSHGGLRLRLSLCCNYTFKRAREHARHGRVLLHEARFNDFIATLVRNLPEPVQRIAPQLFDASRLFVSADYQAIELVTGPVPYGDAKLAVNSILGHPGSAQILDGEDTDERPWNLLVASFTLNCKCPHTLRAGPLLHGRRDEAPQGLELEGGGLRCIDPTSGAPSAVEVSLQPGSLAPYAKTTWTIATRDGRIVGAYHNESPRGIRLTGVPQEVEYVVNVTVTHGEASVTLVSVVGWAFQANFAVHTSVFINSEGAARAQIATLHSTFVFPVVTSFGDSDKCAPESCASAVATEQLLRARLRCSRPHHVINATLIAVSVTPMETAHDIKCSIGDLINACPRAGGRVQVHSVAPVLSGDRERVVCTANTSLTATVKGLPNFVVGRSELTPADLASRAWICVTPAGSSVLNVAEANTVIAVVPDVGMTCTFTVKPTDAMISSMMVPWDPSLVDGASVQVKLSSSYAEFVAVNVEPVRLTTKDAERKLLAPTAKGRWSITHPQIAVDEADRQATIIRGIRLRERFNTTIVWINAVPPCVGHEVTVPVHVTVAPPGEVQLCDHMWYNDICRQIAAPYPKLDEQAEFFVSGVSPPPHNFSLVGPNSAMLCDAADGSKVDVTWRVWNEAGSVEKTCTMQRCSKIPTPTMAPRMLRSIITGSKMKVEVLANFNATRFLGTWTASSPTVTFDDPHATLTVARGFPPGRTTVRFTLDAIGEASRPEDFCPTRSILVHITSEASQCPTAPLRTCSESVVAPYFAMAPSQDRARLRDRLVVPERDFHAACDHVGVAVRLDQASGEINVTGLPEGVNVSCTVSLSQPPGQAAESTYADDEDEVDVDDAIAGCVLTIERVRRAPYPTLALEPFWVGNGTVNATVDVRVPAHRAPGQLHWTLTRRSLAAVESDVVTQAVSALSPRLFSEGDVDTAGVDGWTPMQSTLPIPVFGDTKTTVTVEYVDEYCGRDGTTEAVVSYFARVATDNITTCDHTAPLEGRMIKAGISGDHIRSEWTLRAATISEPMLPDANQTRWIQSVSLPWLAPSPAITDQALPFTSATYLQVGRYEFEFSLFLKHRPSVRHTARLTVHALSRNIPPHEAVIYTTLSKLVLQVAPEARAVSIAPAGFRPAQSPIALRDGDRGHHLFARLYRGSYRLVYHPSPVHGSASEVCPPTVRGRQPTHAAVLQRVALRVIAGWERSVSECDMIRGNAAIVLRLMVAFPNGSFAPPPPGLQFAVRDQRLQASLAAHNPGLWWLSDDVEWNVTSVDATEIDKQHGLHVVPPVLDEQLPAWLRHAVNSTRRADFMGFQTIRIAIRTKRFFSFNELSTPSFQNLNFPVAAISGLADAVNLDTRARAHVRVVQLNGTSVFALNGDPNRVVIFSDEDVATGLFHLDLTVARVTVATSANLSHNETQPQEPIGGFATEAFAMCSRVQDGLAPTLAQWVVGYPAALRDHTVIGCSINATAGSIILRVAANSTFVLARKLEQRLVIPKQALCGLAVDAPSARRVAPTYQEPDVVDLGKLIITRTDLLLQQSRDNVLQCILASEVPPIIATIAGGFVTDRWFNETAASLALTSRAASHEWHPMFVSRTDGHHNREDLGRGPASVAHCIDQLQPKVAFVDRRRFKVRIQPCPALQLPPSSPNVHLNFSLPQVLFDGQEVRDLQVRFDVRGSFAKLQPLLLNASSGEWMPTAVVSEIDLKAGRITFEVSLEGDAWHASVGADPRGAHNTLVARGFGAADDASDDGFELSWRRNQQWLKHSETRGLLRYADELFLPSHVERVSDTVLRITAPPCSTREGSGAKCRRISFSNSPDPVHYFVPGIATACPGCMQAMPPVVVESALGAVVLDRRVDGAWRAVGDDEALSEMPRELAIRPLTSTWATIGWDSVEIRAASTKGEDRGRYVASKVDGGRLVLTLQPAASSTCAGDNCSVALLSSGEVVLLQAVLQPVVFAGSQTAESFLIGPLVLQHAIAISPPVPQEVFGLRLAVAAAHGYLIFFATDVAAAAALGASPHVPAVGVARALGIAASAAMVMSPATSPLSLAIFAIGWSLVFALRGVSLLSLELVASHLALVFMAP